MKYCNNCNLKVNSERDQCPLCFEKLTSVDDEPIKDPFVFQISKTDPSYDSALITKLLLFFAVMTSLVCFMVNKYVPYKYDWWIIVTVSCFFVLLVYLSYKSSINIIVKMNYYCVLSSILLVLLDAVINNFIVLTWSMTIVVPFVLLGNTIINSLIVWRKKRYIRDYILHLMSSIAIGFVPLLVSFKYYADKQWASASCAVASLIIFIAIVLFARKHLAQEVNKTFHI